MELSIGGETFHCTGQRVTEKGFTAIMPWSAVDEKKLPSFLKGERIEVIRVELYEVTFFSSFCCCSFLCTRTQITLNVPVFSLSFLFVSECCKIYRGTLRLRTTLLRVS